MKKSLFKLSQQLDATTLRYSTLGVGVVVILVVTVGVVVGVTVIDGVGD